MRKSLLTVALFVLSPILVAQQTLNNDAVIKLVKAGLSEDLIISTISASPGTYDTSADGLIELKSAGASDKVVSAIMQKATPMGAVAASAAAPGSVGAAEAGVPIVHFYRYKQFEGSALKPSVYCDGVELGRMQSGRFLDVKIPPGQHTFYAEDKQAGAVITLEPGKEYFFRTELQVGFWKGHFRLTMIMPEQGKYDMAKLKPMESKDSVHELPASSPPH